MYKIETEKLILDEKLVAIIRADKIDRVEPLVEALLKGGIKILEVSFNTPGAAEIISSIVKKYGNDVSCGAGTVINEAMAVQAVEAGSEFVISPVFHEEMISTCLSLGIPAIPGVFTPTEALAAYKAGASFLKIFPADVLGSGFIKALKTVFPNLPLIPVGGIDLENAEDFLKNGAAALAVGSSIVNSRLVLKGEYQKIEQNAREFREKVSSCSM